MRHLLRSPPCWLNDCRDVEYARRANVRGHLPRRASNGSAGPCRGCTLYCSVGGYLRWRRRRGCCLCAVAQPGGPGARIRIAGVRGRSGPGSRRRGGASGRLACGHAGDGVVGAAARHGRYGQHDRHAALHVRFRVSGRWGQPDRRRDRAVRDCRDGHAGRGTATDRRSRADVPWPDPDPTRPSSLLAANPAWHRDRKRHRDISQHRPAACVIRRLRRGTQASQGPVPFRTRRHRGGGSAGGSQQRFHRHALHSHAHPWNSGRSRNGVDAVGDADPGNYTRSGSDDQAPRPILGRHSKHVGWKLDAAYFKTAPGRNVDKIADDFLPPALLRDTRLLLCRSLQRGECTVHRVSRRGCGRCRLRVPAPRLQPGAAHSRAGVRPDAGAERPPFHAAFAWRPSGLR